MKKKTQNSQNVLTIFRHVGRLNVLPILPFKFLTSCSQR
jgi:hypothetical protein